MADNEYRPAVQPLSEFQESANYSDESTPGPVPDQEVPAQHVHHSYIWLGSIRIILALLFAALITFLSSVADEILSGEFSDPEAHDVISQVALWTGAALVLVSVIIIVYQIISYRFLYYKLLPSEFHLYRGILNKKRVHVPYQRIQSVDQRASLLQRLFGVCTVSIDTAGGANNKAVTIPYLTKNQAESLRIQLFAHKTYLMSAAEGAPPTPVPTGVVTGKGNILDAPAGLWDELGGLFAGQAVDTGSVSYSYGLTNKELLLTGISNNTAFLMVAIGVVATIFEIASNLFMAVPQSGAVVIGTLGNATQNGQVFNIVGWGVGLIIVVAILAWLASAVVTCLNYGGFHARRRQSRIEVERGLLQHHFMGVDIDRVQSVVIKQSFIRRLIGYCELSLGKIDAGQSDDSSDNNGLAQEGLVIHPFVKLNRVPEILAGLVPEYANVPTDVHAVAPVALRRGLIRRCIWAGTGFWVAVFVAASQIIAHLVFPGTGMDDATVNFCVDVAALVGYIFAAVLFVLDIIGTVFWFRESGFAINRQFMQVSIGGLSRETSCFPRQKIQYGYSRSNPLQRLAKTATINTRTAAGVGGTTIRLIDVSEEDAETWLAWLKPRGNVLQ